MTDPRPSIFSELLIKPDERRSFLIALALVALARAQAAFAFTYSVDDYRVFIQGFQWVAPRLVDEGRFGTYWLSKAFDFIGYDPMRGPLITVVASVFLSVWAANAILRLWSNDLPNVIRAMLLVIIAAHPYTSEIITFRNIAIYHILAFALGAAAILISQISPARLLVSALVFSAALMFYQVPLNYISIFICFDLALRVIRGLLSNDVPLAYSLRDRSFYARIVTVAAGFAIYVVCLKIATHGLPPHPFSIPISLGEVPERLRTWGVKLLVGHFVTGTIYGNQLVPKAILIIPWLFIGATVFELLRRPTNQLGNSALASAVVVVTPTIAGLAMLGIPLFFTVIWLPSRVMASIGVIWAGVAVVALLVQNFIPRQVYVLALGLIVFSFIAVDNQIFIDQLRVGVRDHNLAVRVASRLEEQPNFSDMKTLAGEGRRSDAGVPIPTATHGFNDSNWEYQWAVSPMVAELTGIPLRAPYQPELDAAEAYCKGQSPWPAPGSVIIRGPLAIVCLGS
ncbi:hypothetical protein [Mesorhizobium sp. M0715]|uniref:hypothetical protein n=1 Tax=Mesorhizobium sp. M0715 TaxID=2956990 RepID=UPI00333DDFCE